VYDINPAGGEVGGEKHPHVAGLKIRERPATGALAEIAVQGGGRILYRYAPCLAR